MTEPREFQNQFRHLRKIILDGISYYIVWQKLDAEYSKSLSLFPSKGFWWQYRGFFAPTRNALLWSALVQLSKAYDSDPRCVSLNNLAVKARNDPSFAPYGTQDSLEEIQVRILNNREILLKLRQYRNKRLVHYDSTQMENIMIPVYKVTALVEDTKAIFNLLKYACEGDSDDFDLYMEDVSLHTSQVIDTMIRAEKSG
jgi:hypothetical protein